MLRIIFITFTIIEYAYGRTSLPDKTDKSFLNDCVDSHNQYRKSHGSPPIIIDSKLVEYAKQRARHVSQYESLSAGHKDLRKGTGENLYWGGSSNENQLKPCSEAIKLFYDEIGKYNFNKPGFSSATGHFTQVVWKESRRIGCARAFGKGSKWYETYIVCNYEPPGNFGGSDDYKRNVLKRGSG